MPTKDMFSLVRSKGMRVSSPAFSVYYKDMGVTTKPRVVISQKVDKRATVRNRLRRQIREILMKHAPHLTVLIVVKKPILEMTFGEMQASLYRLIRK